MTRYMKQFDMMIRSSINYKQYTLRFTRALRLAAVLLVMMVA